MRVLRGDCSSEITLETLLCDSSGFVFMRQHDVLGLLSFPHLIDSPLECLHTTSPGSRRSQLMYLPFDEADWKCPTASQEMKLDFIMLMCSIPIFLRQHDVLGLISCTD